MTQKKIKFTDSNKVDGFYFLMKFGSVTSLPNDEYIVSDNILNMLKDEGLDFKVIIEY